MIEHTTQNKIAKNDLWDYGMCELRRGRGHSGSNISAKAVIQDYKIRTRYRQRSTQKLTFTISNTMITITNFPSICHTSKPQLILKGDP